MYKKILINCECESHALEVERLFEDKEYYLSMWNRGRSYFPMSFRERLRWCWNILKTGVPYTDQMILNDEEMNKIIDFVNSVKKVEKL
jgi:hypothetical protein